MQWGQACWQRNHALAEQGQAEERSSAAKEHEKSDGDAKFPAHGFRQY